MQSNFKTQLFSGIESISKLRVLSIVPFKVAAFVALSFFLLPISYAQTSPIKGCENACNLIKNGDFEAGNTGFTSDFPQGCGRCSATSICVVTKFSDKCSLWPTAGVSNTGTGKFLAVDGSNLKDGMLIWKKDLKGCCRGITYTFSFKAINLFGTAGPDKITLMINGSAYQTFTVDSKVWTTYSCTYTGCASTIALRQDTKAEKSDIGIDDIFFGFCTCACNPQ